MKGNSDRFYIKDGLGQETLIIDDPALLKQWRKVLRLKTGDRLRLFEGSGWEYNYELRMTNDELRMTNEKCRGGVVPPKTGEINLELIDKKFTEEPPTKIILNFGILKNNHRTEWMIEKCTELGVAQFQPLICDNSQISHLKNRERLYKKIIEACEQSGRVRVPLINEELQITNYELNCDGAKICMDICDDIQLTCRGGVIPPKTEGHTVINLFTGPEGGWSDAEKKWFHDNNFQFWQINQNTLRAETAAVAGVGVLAGEWGI